MSSNLNFKLFNWWNISLNNVLFYDYTNSQNSDLTIDVNNWSTQFTTNNRISLPKKFTLSFTTDYISPFIQGTYKTNSLFSLNVSISKSFFNNSLFLSLTGNDILNTYEIFNQFKNQFESVSLNQNIDVRWLRLNLVYKFKKGLNKSSTQNNKTIDGVKNRIK